MNAFETLQEALYYYLHDNERDGKLGPFDNVVIKIKYDYQCAVRRCWESRNGIMVNNENFKMYFMSMLMVVDETIPGDFEIIPEREYQQNG